MCWSVFILSNMNDGKWEWDGDIKIVWSEKEIVIESHDNDDGVDDDEMPICMNGSTKNKKLYYFLYLFLTLLTCKRNTSIWFEEATFMHEINMVQFQWGCNSFKWYIIRNADFHLMDFLLPH